MADSPTGFSWPFLEDMSRWTLGIGTRGGARRRHRASSPMFAAAVLAGVLADVAIVRTTVHRAMKAEGSTPSRRRSPGCSSAFDSPSRQSSSWWRISPGTPQLFWGAVLGVVLFDTVLLTVGSVKAASTMFQTKER